jgi:hypothetical protein
MGAEVVFVSDQLDRLTGHPCGCPAGSEAPAGPVFFSF